MNTLDGWLSSKKSDAQVARDSKRAREERKRKNPVRRNGTAAAKPNAKPNAKPKAKANAKPSGATNRNGRNGRNSTRYNNNNNKNKNNKNNDSSFIDDDEELDDEYEEEEELSEKDESSESEEEAFDSGMEDEDDDEDDDDDVLIHDEDDDSDEDMDAELDADEVIFPKESSRRSRAAARNSRRQPNYNDHTNNNGSDSDINSDNSDSLLPKGTIRPSAPSRLLKANAGAAKRRYNPSLDSSAFLRASKKARGATESQSMRQSKTPKLQPPAVKAQAKSRCITLDDDSDSYDESDGENDDEEEELTSPLCSPNKISSTNRQQQQQRASKKQDYEEIFSSDEENNRGTSTGNGNRNGNRNVKPLNSNSNSKSNSNSNSNSNSSVESSKYFKTQKSRAHKNTILSDDSDSDSDSDEDLGGKSLTTAAKHKHKQKHKLNTNGRSKVTSSILEDTPEPPIRTKKTTKATRLVLSIDDDESSDDDDNVLQTGAGNNKSNKINRNHYDDDDDSDKDFDEDTRVAMRLSLKESKKKSTKAGSFQKPNRNKLNDDEDDGVVNIETLLDESSDDDGDDGDQGDEYYDKEKETATNVLRSAERLSGYVVRAMSGWFRGSSGGSGNAVHGMIVDGAIALGTPRDSDDDPREERAGNDTGNDTGNGNHTGNGNTGDQQQQQQQQQQHQWIGQSVMAKACPNVTLSPYQLVGVNWMALLNGMTCEVGTKGTKNVNGVLADEMGLGKTVQTIAFLAWLRHRGRTSSSSSSSSQTATNKCTTAGAKALPHLIVVPVSTLPNWIREFEKFCPEMNVVKYHGSQAEREDIKEGLKAYLPKYRHQYAVPNTPLDVIVASVSYFQKENSPDRKFLSNFAYDYLVVDEAHNLKNAKSTRYKMLDRVKTEHRLLLTGTPVQNNPQELLNMLSFIMPLFSKAGASFEEKDNYTEQMLKHFVDDRVEHGDEQTAYKKLKQLFAPFVLRRKKDDVMGQLLPKKTRKTIFVELSESTRTIYENIVRSHFETNGSTINPGTGEHLFTNLRKCAHHPLLLRNRWNCEAEREQLVENFYRFGAFKGEGCTKQRVREEIESWNDFNIHLTALDLIDENEHRRPDLQRYVLQENDLFCSSKFESLRDLLPDLIRDGHRILIFSSWTSCLDLLGCLLQHLGILFQRMDGSCPSDERQRLIDRFNTDASCSVFLLSTKACGLGINLTSADTCIIHDLDFNPFNDLQAEDRCHRIGQKKPVTVYKLITRDSVDEDIYKMQEKKAKMNAAIMDSSSSRKEKKAILKSVLDKASHGGNDNEETVL